MNRWRLDSLTSFLIRRFFTKCQIFTFKDKHWRSSFSSLRQSFLRALFGRRMATGRRLFLANAFLFIDAQKVVFSFFLWNVYAFNVWVVQAPLGEIFIVAAVHHHCVYRLRQRALLEIMKIRVVFERCFHGSQRLPPFSLDGLLSCLGTQNHFKVDRQPLQRLQIQQW